MTIVSGVDLGVDHEKALQARAWFATHGPGNAPALPLCYAEGEAMKNGRLGHLVALYARSLALQDYDVERHPSFPDYARGAMASGLFPGNRLREFPPRRLAGLNNGLCWNPPTQKKVGGARAH